MKTVLYDRHCQLAAKMVNFSGWEMPIQYSSIIQEHKTVRHDVGLFDVSHMGQILVQGDDAEKFLDYISTNKITNKLDNTATYTLWCNENGTCVDDVIVYRKSAQNYFVVVNAGNREKDLNHLLKYSKNFKVTIKDLYTENGIISIQGPKSLDLLKTLFPEMPSLNFMNFCEVTCFNESLVISRTGYTGELGFEIYASNPLIEKLWDLLLEKGQSFGVKPIGLGARDTLRLEKGYALYGHEINESIFAIESVSAWTLKWDKDFIGKNALLELKDKDHRHEYGVVLDEKAIPREGYEVYCNDTLIGTVTSGNYSPSLDKSIAIVLSNKVLSVGGKISIIIRGKQSQGHVIKFPFI